MRKKIVIITTTTILLLLLVQSAIAVPKNKDPKPDNPNKLDNTQREITIFTESATLRAGNIYLGNQEITDNGILYVQDAISTGTIPSGDSPISGFEIQTSLSGTSDLNTFLGSFNGNWIITSESGSFEGTIVGNVAVATISGKFVSHGTGDFEGQKIKGTFEGSVNNFKIELIIQVTLITK